jgi:uncharacterized protein
VTERSVCVAEGLVMDAGEAATQTLGAIGAKGSGKSYLAGVFVEQLAAAGAMFCVLDPVGNWNALTLASDGKGPGLPVVVIGGERGDVPLDLDNGELLGAFLIENCVSAVIDLSELSKTKRKSFVADVAEAMFRTARRFKTPYCVVFEECQLFAPQHAGRGEERMLGAITDIVRLGRNYGLGCVMLTQRPQSVSKEVLNMIECLFVGNLRGPQERKTIKGWIDETGAEAARAGLDELPKLAPGEFFCWSPSWLRTFRRVRIGKKRTFDGSSTPKLGQRAAPLPARAARGLDSVIAELVALGPPPKAAPGVAVVDESAELAELRSLCENAEEENASLLERIERAETLLDKLRDALEPVFLALNVGEPPPPAAPVRKPPTVDDARHTAKAKPQRSKPAPAPAGTGELDGPMRKILTVLVAHGRMPKRRLALLAGYSAGGGGFNNPLGRLRTAGFAEGGNEIGPTEAGRRAIGRIDNPPPSMGRALLEWWLTQPSVDGPMGKILGALAKQRHPVMPDELANLAGYKPATGGFNNPLGRLKTLGLVLGGRGEPLRLADQLRGKVAA